MSSARSNRRYRTTASKRRCRIATCSRSARRTMSNGSTSAATSGRFSTSSLMRASNLTVPTMPTLRPKLRKLARLLAVDQELGIDPDRTVQAEQARPAFHDLCEQHAACHVASLGPFAKHRLQFVEPQQLKRQRVGADLGVDRRHREEIERLVHLGNRATVILGNGAHFPFALRTRMRRSRSCVTVWRWPSNARSSNRIRA